MKVRNGFVSNSSASSFVCQACQSSFEGHDGDYGDNTYQASCVNGHTLCNECIKEGSNLDFTMDDVPEQFCPICSLEVFDPEQILQFLMKKYDLTEQEVREEIKERFPAYKDLLEYIR